jgi:hypothetical protein
VLRGPGVLLLGCTSPRTAACSPRGRSTALSGASSTNRPRFEEFELRYRREYGLFYEFLVAFYDVHVGEESYFWQAKKVTRCPKSELESFAELVGGVASGEPALSAPDAVGVRLSSASGELAEAVSRARVATSSAWASSTPRCAREQWCSGGPCSARPPAPRIRYGRGASSRPNDGMHWVRGHHDLTD